MGHSHFMLQDLIRTWGAFSLFPLFLLVPGYVIGWLTDVLSFRQRPLATRLLLGMALSVAVSPAVTYLVARLSSFGCVWCFYAITWLAMLVLAGNKVVRLGPRAAIKLLLGDRSLLAPVAIGAAWVALATVSLVDLEFGGRLYFTVAVQDYAKHVAVTDAITRTGVPPVNPSFYPGQPVELFYYYFWFLLCSLVDRLGGSLVGPRHAVLGGTIWCGLALMAVVSLYVRFLGQKSRERGRTGAVLGVALLGVSGVDLIPVLEQSLRSLAAGSNILRADLEWWNEQVTAWLGAMLWVPHHVAGLVACLTTFLLLVATRPSCRRERVVIAALCGLALASALGLSIWVAFVFAAFLAVSLVISVSRRQTSEAGLLAVVGFSWVLLSAPYLLDLSESGRMSTTPIAFTIRPFWPAETALSSLGIDDVWVRHFANLLLLPVNYTIELGFFFVAAALYWRRRLKRRESLDEMDRATITLLSTSVLVCTFLRSSIRNNDLGWRGFMFAQFVLLLWSIDPAMALFRRLFRRDSLAATTGFGLTRQVRIGVSLLLVVGAMTTLCEVTSLRIYPVLADMQVIGMPDWLSPDNRLGERTYALRQVHQWIRDELPGDAIVQHNPEVWKDLYGFYGERQVAIADYENGMLFGVPESVFLPVQTSAARIFLSDSDLAGVKDVCERLSISVLLVKDVDPVWKNDQSWVWQDRPLFANDFAKLFRCTVPTVE